MSTIATLSNCPCISCAYQIRSIGAQLEGGGDATNIVNWVNDYDITTVAWGDYHQGNFTDPSQTSPPTTSDTSCTSGACSPQNGLLCVGPADEDGNCTIVACDTPLVQRSQYLIPFAIAYYVIAYGTSISAAPVEDRSCGEGGDWFSMGCIFGMESASDYPLTVDLPIPDNTLDDTILVQNYYLGIISPGASIPASGVLSEEISILPNLTSLTPSNAGVAGFGSNWSASLSTACYGPMDDPFTGSDPP
jgi:hypothetical protein